MKIIETKIFIAFIVAFFLIFGALSAQGINNNEQIEAKTNPTLNNLNLQDRDPITGSVALFKDRLTNSDGWGYASNEAALDAVGLNYDVFTRSQIGVADISGYEKVVIAGNQDSDPDYNAFHDAIIGNATYFESYANNGGILQVHAGTNGYWNGTLPGGTVYSESGHEQVVIIDPDHQLFNTPNSVTETGLSNWNWSWHGFLANYSASANVLLTGNDTYLEQNEPILVEDPFGSGFVITSSQTLEHGYSHPDGELFLQNLMLYNPLGIADVALFKENNAWSLGEGQNSNQDALDYLGLTYDVYTSTDMGVVDLSSYDRVIIESEQTVAFNDAVSANAEYFEDYAAQGGILEMHAATNSQWNGGLPGGLTYYDTPISQVTILSEPSANLFNTPYVVNNANLSLWSSSAHGTLENVPADAITHLWGLDDGYGELALQDVGDEGPILVEQQWGNGFILTSTQTLEYGWNYADSYFLANLLNHQPAQLSVSQPDNQVLELSNDPFSLSWNVDGDTDGTYGIYVNNVLTESGNWNDGNDIVFDHSYLELGDNLVILIADSPNAWSVSSTVLVYVEDTTPATITGEEVILWTKGDPIPVIGWSISDESTMSFVVNVDGEQVAEGVAPSGSTFLDYPAVTDLFVGVDPLDIEAGNYVIELIITDAVGNVADFVVTLIVYDAVETSTPPTTSDDPTTTDDPTTSNEPTTSEDPETSEDQEDTDTSLPPNPLPINLMVALTGLFIIGLIRRKRI